MQPLHRPTSLRLPIGGQTYIVTLIVAAAGTRALFDSASAQAYPTTALAGP